MSAKNESGKSLQRTANSAVLFISLGVVAAPIAYSLYQAGLVVSSVSDLSVYGATWMNATEGGTIVHGAALMVLLLIGVLHIANRKIGAQLPLLERIVSLLLKFPVAFVLLTFASWIGFMGYGKYEVGINTANLNGGGYALDWICAAALVYLMLFVKKV